MQRPPPARDLYHPTNAEILDGRDLPADAPEEAVLGNDRRILAFGGETMTVISGGVRREVVVGGRRRAVVGPRFLAPERPGQDGGGLLCVRCRSRWLLALRGTRNFCCSVCGEVVR